MFVKMFARALGLIWRLRQGVAALVEIALIRRVFPKLCIERR